MLAPPGSTDQQIGSSGGGVAHGNDTRPAFGTQPDLWPHGADRRTFLKGAGLAMATGAAGSQLGRASARAATAPSGRIPIKHVIVDCQENRSFDHYYGFAPFAGRFGVPAGYSQPDGHGGAVTPFHFTSLTTPDIGHSWFAMHAAYDSGAMDGFYTTNGIDCLGNPQLPARPGRAPAGQCPDGNGYPAAACHRAAELIRGDIGNMLECFQF
jgi:hypothetical protein